MDLWSLLYYSLSLSLSLSLSHTHTHTHTFHEVMPCVTIIYLTEFTDTTLILERNSNLYMNNSALLWTLCK